MKNNIEKYFNQKSISVLDIVFIILIIVSSILFIFVNGIGMIGLGLVLVSVAGLFVARSFRIKESAVDEKLQELILRLDLKGGETIGTYDLKYTALRGKDGKFRSECYVISEYDFSEDLLKIGVYRIYLTDEAITEKHYKIQKSDKITLVEELVSTMNANKQILSLSADVFAGETVPVVTSDVDSAKLVEKVCSWSR